MKKSKKKYLEKIYNKVAPMVNPTIAKKNPIHLPNIKPPSKAIGLPKPKRNTQIIVKNIKIKDINIKLFSLKEIKYSLFNCINL